MLAMFDGDYKRTADDRLYEESVRKCEEAERSTALTDRLDQSNNREAQTMQITITTDRNPEAWGAECDEVLADKAAWRLAQALAEFAEERWPEAEVEFGTEHVPSGERNLIAIVGGAADGIEAGDVVARIEFEQERIWTDCLQAADA